jgi:cyclase
MLRPRIIPCLLIRNKGLVKTIRFQDDRYIGDPINTVKIFNEKQVDELIAIDIDASAKNYEPDYHMIANLARECRMPLCYCGGVKTVEQALKIIGLGVEKVAVSSAAIQDPSLIEKMAKEIGTQSVVVVLDAKKKSLGKGYNTYLFNGKMASSHDPADLAEEMERRGAGEIVVNSIDQDGTMKGYDMVLASMIRERISLPLTILGGAGALRDIESLIKKFGIIGAAAGSLFIYKGPTRGVLINYPNPGIKEEIIARSLNQVIDTKSLS